MWRRDDSRNHSGHSLHGKSHWPGLEDGETKLLTLQQNFGVEFQLNSHGEGSNREKQKS